MMTLSQILNAYYAEELSQSSVPVLIEAQLTVDALIRTMHRCKETQFTISTPNQVRRSVTLASLVEVGDAINTILNTHYGSDGMTTVK